MVSFLWIINAIYFDHVRCILSMDWLSIWIWYHMDYFIILLDYFMIGEQTIWHSFLIIWLFCVFLYILSWHVLYIRIYHYGFHFLYGLFFWYDLLMIISMPLVSWSIRRTWPFPGMVSLSHSARWCHRGGKGLRMGPPNGYIDREQDGLTIRWGIYKYISIYLNIYIYNIYI